jgi:hypothetical protein
MDCPLGEASIFRTEPVVLASKANDLRAELIDRDLIKAALKGWEVH